MHQVLFAVESSIERAASAIVSCIERKIPSFGKTLVPTAKSGGGSGKRSDEVQQRRIVQAVVKICFQGYALE
jgi:hypothetical protein